jgi:uncharacterized protein DUF1553/uncharacterized protein DUF1549
MRLVFVILLAAAVSLAAGDDPYCPVYPKSQRVADQARLDLEKEASAFSRQQRRNHQSPAQANLMLPASVNLIDAYIFGKMAADGVESAPLSSDQEILRRLYLDLTGRIPTTDDAVGFLQDGAADKRVQLIDRLMNSVAFVDYWTFFYANQFEVTSRYYNFVGIPGRNLFYNSVRDFVASGRSYRDFASELITATGDSHQNGALNFAVRGVQQGDPVQDTYDTLTDRITTKFLGIQSQCISCHNGAHHLEPINLYLSVRKRDEFWRQSAFLSRTSLNAIPADPYYNQVHFLVIDRPTGGYTTIVDPNNPGPRPARSGGPYNAQYLLTGETPTSNNWRAELARIVTSDKQFARATVNYIWAHFFKYGIVDPPDGWDLARVDPNNPPPGPWVVQPSHPELLEALADEFIQSNYDFRHIIRLIVESNAYQLSGRYTGQWKPIYELYFAKHFPRRLYAEEIYDAVITATGTEVPMQVEGFSRPLYYATQLPDVTEPRNNFSISNFLTTFGRGDWWQVPRRQSSDVLQVLYQMNDTQINFRTFGNRNVTTNVTRVMEAGVGDREAVNRLFLATLSREVTDQEYSILIGKKTANYEQWLSDIQWALLNKIDFVFSN